MIASAFTTHLSSLIKNSSARSVNVIQKKELNVRFSFSSQLQTSIRFFLFVIHWSRTTLVLFESPDYFGLGVRVRFLHSSSGNAYCLRKQLFLFLLFFILRKAQSGPSELWYEFSEFWVNSEKGYI